ncbi:MAG TPA: heme lyase CcmF/NrfE family subunit, partial [Hellea balneolensis]|nr:heme lyase CcmF/NrfE family subunit [Hellea balneolensis]
LSIQGMIGLGFLAFILFTSNPFLRLSPAPINGNGLNPLLQDPGLAYHPPFLYLGYVGFSVAFSFSVAALLEGRVDAVWARWLRPWVLVAWSFLTIGITMGSVWAYYELGWGGWWMWDPVENVSFMPWLVGTALLHSIMVLGKRHTMANWTVLLGISAFSLSLIGTFIVRSGVLVSVHAFAVDPARGVFILLLLAIATGGALTLYALRSSSLRAVGGFGLVSKEGGLLLNNMLLAAACATVFLGTFYPLFIDIVFRDKISVGPPYFDATFAPIMCLLIVFMGIGPLLKWRQGSLSDLRRPLRILVPVFVVVVLAIYIWGKSVLGALAMGLAVYLLVGALIAFGRKIKLLQIPLAGSLKMLRAQPASTYAFVLSHIGLAIAMMGIVAMSVWSGEAAGRLKPGEHLNIGAYEFVLKDLKPGAEKNYEFIKAQINVSKNGEPVTSLTTARRFFAVRGMVTSEAGIKVGLWRNLYVGLSDGNEKDGWVVRAYIHPLVDWIWAGALLMALAGFIGVFGAGGGRTSET